MKTDEKEQYIEGRGGLKVPKLDKRGMWNSTSVLLFLRGLQTVNGLDISTFRGSGERRQPRSFHNVLMIGKTGTKPLVVIQGSYEPRARSEVEYELRRNREKQEWGQWSAATTGYEKHSIYVSPTELEDSTALLEVEHRLTEGGSGSYWENNTWLSVNGERKETSDFFPVPNDYTDENQQLGAVAYSDFLKQTVADVVTLLK